MTILDFHESRRLRVCCCCCESPRDCCRFPSKILDSLEGGRVNPGSNGLLSLACCVEVGAAAEGRDAAANDVDVDIVVDEERDAAANDVDVDVVVDEVAVIIVAVADVVGADVVIEAAAVVAVGDVDVANADVAVVSEEDVAIVSEADAAVCEDAAVDDVAFNKS